MINTSTISRKQPAAYERHYNILLALSLAALSIFRYYYILTGPNGLSFDEAQYWQWSRHLDLSYYSKGPVIAWLIAFSTWLAGDTELGVRLFAPVFLALTSVFIYKLTAAMLHNARTAFISAMLIHIIPLFSVHGIVMSIDPPFIFFWTLSLYLFWKATCMEEGTEKTTDSSHDARLFYWLSLGLAIGLGLLTKYTMAFFYLCAFLAVLNSGEHRKLFMKKGPWLAFIMSLLVFTPVIIWNMEHEWLSLKHTGGHAEIGRGMNLSFEDFFEFIGSQFGVISPLVLIAAIYGAIKDRSSKNTSWAKSILFWFWMPVLVFFIMKSLQGKVQANWAMPAYITAFIASADFFLKKGLPRGGQKIFFGLALGTALFITVAAHYPAILDLPPKMDSTARLRGWKEVGIKTGEIYRDMVSSKDTPVFIFSDYYKVSSALAFYMPGKPQTYLAKLSNRRMNQYDIWGGFDRLIGFDAIFVSSRDDYRVFPEKLKKAFDSYTGEKFTVMERGRVLREYYIYKCYGFKGFAPDTFEKY